MDQAKKLREMMRDLNENNIKLDQEEIKNKKMGKVISVSSGKGGVGKTNFAINFSIALKRRGYRVLILDADIGLGNVEILTGTNSKYNISDIIYSDKKMEDIIGNGPEGLEILSGGSGLQELNLLSNNNLTRLLKELSRLQRVYDYIIIDTGAGISSAVLDFVMATDDVIIIATPDPTSVMDAYVLVKSLNISNYKGNIHLVSNFVKNASQGYDIYYKINNAAKQFLQIELDYLGYLLRDDRVTRSVRCQMPFIINYPRIAISKQIQDVVDNLLIVYGKIEDKQDESFTDKLFKIFLK